MSWDNKNILEVLKKNGVVVMPTDTLYGIVGKAEKASVVERVYTIRKRNTNKPCIILIGNINELEKFSIHTSQEQKTAIKKYWSGSVSIILECPEEKFAYLHRGTKTLAFRIPAQKELQNLLKETGPLVAPSANPEGLPPAENITEAKNYFGDTVDLYIDGGEIKGKASKVIKLHKDGSVTVIRS